MSESPKNVDSASSSTPNEVVGEWSETVEHLRGRLIAEFGIDASGATEVGISIELQNFNTGVLGRRIVTFARDRSLHWEMTDTRGKAVPEWAGDVPWTIDFFYVNETIAVPAGGRVRFPICSGSYHLLGEGVFGQAPFATVFFQGPGRPLWHLVDGGDQPYLLKATFKGMEQSQSDFDFLWSGPISLPPVLLQTKPKTVEPPRPVR